ncbi:hypothetical protein [Aliikangiella coralliicola]|uniref:Uncharacterized protein n=1 Tax=Aliikangiella coralliicola TaxID=2592383 RepID=A0A545UA52_9GAMM|nr:hypothetical protein [Aliikangiella coralliicola]TQV86340.1 hypothetical protein FLL46_15560 [Aliikangiella coralliicola]
MISQIIKCDGCKNSGELRIGQSYSEKKVVWYKSFRCASCGQAYEVDGDDTPEELRNLLLDEEGVHSVVLMDKKKRTFSIKVLRNTLGLSMEEVKDMLAKKDEVLFEGTSTEAKFIENCLAKNGIESIIQSNSR